MFYSILKEPFDLKIERDDDVHWISVPLAQGDDGNRVVSVVAEFAPMLIDGDEYAEFSFGIEVFALDESMEDFQTQERDVAEGFIPQNVRPDVMRIVCAALTELTDQLGPSRIYWVTKGRDLPEKALGKYYMLAETLERVGFSLMDEGTDAFGRRFWSMGR